MNTVLTISIAAYNVETYIEPLLNRFLKCKAIEKIEILVIDDGATDSTLALAKKYTQKYPNVFRAIHKENGGWGSTVNTGIQLATGKYFKLLDGDDYFNSESLDKIVDYLESCDTDVVMSPYTRFFDENDEVANVVENPLFTGSSPSIISVKDIPILPFSLEMYSLTFKTNMLKQAGIRISENCFYTDNEYVAKGIQKCKSFSVVPYNLYCYRVGRFGQSVSIEGMRKHYREFDSVLRNTLLYIKENEYDPHLKKIFFERYRGLTYYYYEVLFSLGNEEEYANSCKEFDRWLKMTFPEIYKGVKYIPIIIFRLARYSLWGCARLFR